MFIISKTRAVQSNLSAQLDPGRVLGIVRSNPDALNSSSFGDNEVMNIRKSWIFDQNVGYSLVKSVENHCFSWILEKFCLFEFPAQLKPRCVRESAGTHEVGGLPSLHFLQYGWKKSNKSLKFVKNQRFSLSKKNTQNAE